MKTVIFCLVFAHITIAYGQNVLDLGVYSRTSEFIPYITAHGHAQAWDTYALKSVLHISNTNQFSLVTIGFGQEDKFFIGGGPAVMRDRIPSFGKPFPVWNTEIGPGGILYANFEKTTIAVNTIITNVVWYQASIQVPFSEWMSIGLVSRNFSGCGTGLEIEYGSRITRFAAQILRHPDGALATAGLLRIRL